MRGRLWKNVGTCFIREFEPRFPQFTVGYREGQFWTWVWKAAPDLYFFVVLQGFDRKDQFVLEIAWSREDEFPWGAFGDADAGKPELRERLGAIWNSARGERHEHIWDLAPEKTAADVEHIEARARGAHLPYADDPPVELLLPRIGPLVHDAIEKLEQYGMPLFRRVAEAHGVKWPDTPRTGEQLKGEK